MLIEKRHELAKPERLQFRDAAYLYRMGAGYPGQVNKQHPSNIVAARPDATVPPTNYGLACVLKSTGNVIRAMAATDTALTDLYGIIARDFPAQQQLTGASGTYGGVGFGTVGSLTAAKDMSVLLSGFITVQCYTGQTPVKGGTVYVRIAASSGNHVQGGFEAAADGTNNIAITGSRTYWNSPVDASGYAEIAFNI
jgi:hypothetical protein